MIKAFTLVETVVAVGIFAILATIGSLLLFGALRGSRKLRLFLWFEPKVCLLLRV